MMRTQIIGLAILTAMTWTSVGQAQRRPDRPGGRAGPPHPEVTVDWTGIEQRIAWFGTLKGGLAAAEATGRPLLFISGAPHCQSVPGVW